MESKIMALKSWAIKIINMKAESEIKIIDQTISNGDSIEVIK